MNREHQEPYFEQRFNLVLVSSFEIGDELVEPLDVPGVHSALVARVVAEPSVVRGGEESVEPARRVQALDQRLVVDEQVPADDGLVLGQHQLRNRLLA